MELVEVDRVLAAGRSLIRCHHLPFVTLLAQSPSESAVAWEGPVSAQSPALAPL